MVSYRLLSSSVVLAAAVLAGAGSGCARRAATTPAVPPPSAPQRVQQIQSDPNVPQAVKDVRLYNAANSSGPPIRRGPAPGQ
jgi:hypothetical protein